MDDVLEVTDDCNLPKLRDLYKDRGSDTDHIYNYLCTVIKWKTLHPDSKYFTILVPREDQSTGTFIGINRYNCSELFMSTLETTGDWLHKAIAETKLIDWTQAWKIFALPGRLHTIVLKALATTPYEHAISYCGNIWWAPKEKIVECSVNCPDEVYVSELKPAHAKIINQVWPPRYTNSQYYLEAMIKMNGGCGVFLKNSDELVASTINDPIGLGALQTLSSQRNKGYGSLVSLHLAKKIAADGYNPLATVRQGNKATEAMFKKIGFEIGGTVYYVINKQMQDLENCEKL